MMQHWFDSYSTETRCDPSAAELAARRAVVAGANALRVCPCCGQVITGGVAPVPSGYAQHSPEIDNSASASATFDNASEPLRSGWREREPLL